MQKSRSSSLYTIFKQTEFPEQNGKSFQSEIENLKSEI